ncbi:MAG: hypothetical protein LBU55_03605 [Elusimicrobiota bacterium]|jgi:hypothetical protein|nr:hypothetical protein [Elusimicrobiota bacterium]
MRIRTKLQATIKIKFRFFLAFSVAFLSLSSCGVSYPKESITQSLETLVKKETGKNVKASIIGRTLYLDMELENLTSSDQSSAKDVMKNIQAAAFAITRVVLSSDSNIKYMIANIYDPNRYLVFKIIQNLSDIKNYLYMRISRDDYISRNLYEMETLQNAAKAINSKKDISDEEFVGRLIVSNINSTPKTNPFFGTILSSLNLRYVGIKSKILVLATNAHIEDNVKTLLERFIHEKMLEFSKKYNLHFYGFELFAANGSLVIQKIYQKTIIQTQADM